MYLPYYICVIVSWSIQSLNSLLFTENVLIPHKHDSTVKDHWWDASHISLVLLYKSKTFELSRGPDLLPPPPPIDPRMYPINKILKNPNKHTQHVTVKCCTIWKPHWHCTGASYCYCWNLWRGRCLLPILYARWSRFI